MSFDAQKECEKVEFDTAQVFITQLAADDYEVIVFEEGDEDGVGFRVEAVFVNTTQVYLDPEDELVLGSADVSVGEHHAHPGDFAWVYVA